MGFIKAFAGALSGSFADQWKDFYVPMPGVPGTAGLFRAVPNTADANRNTNEKGSDNIITNGSKIVVPEGMALITMQDGGITGVITEPGGFIYSSDDPNSRSMFTGDGFFASTFGTSIQRFKFGGVAGTQQLAFYVNLKEISGLKFGTQKPIYWRDSYLDLQAGGMARGSYSLKIVDPVLFIKGFVPNLYLQPDAPVFDFADMDNEAGNQLFNEFLMTLDKAVSTVSIEAKTSDIDTISYLQSNPEKFAPIMTSALETNYNWEQNRGLKVQNISIMVDYDEKTQAILDEIRADDAEIRKAKRMGEAYQNNMAGMMASASGEAMKNAAANENGAMMGFMGMNMAQQSGANMLGAINNMPNQGQDVASANAQNPTDKLLEMKKLLDAGAITQEDYDKVKNQILGL